MKRTIKNPYWMNNARTLLSAEFHYDDGRIVEAQISETDVNNADLREIKEKFTREVIEANTQAKMRQVAKRQAEEKQKADALKLRKAQEELFAIKMKIFEIDQIKASTNRTLKSFIRRSKTDVEAMAYASALLMSEFNNTLGNQHAPPPQTPPTPPETPTKDPVTAE